jgi:hypothetical protein
VTIVRVVPTDSRAWRASPSRIRRLASLASALAVALALGSCGDAPSEPKTHGPVTRTVTAVFRDSLGAPLANAATRWVSPVRSDGTIELRDGQTDAAGADAQTLWNGVWFVVASSGPLVAGAEAVVAGAERAESDTQQVDLVAHTASIVTGTATLAGRTDHSGTVASAHFPGLDVTGPDGVWSLGYVPLGRWTISLEHAVYKSGLATVAVTTPGSSLVAPTVRLDSDPLP